MNKNLLSSTLLLITMIGGFAIAGTIHFETVQASTDVIGIITSDTTWTKANSPYNIRGPVSVPEGVTLTIEAGVSLVYGFEEGVQYYIEVNGTLIAKGTSADPIRFGSLGISFTSTSSSWDEQAGAGCIIENAIIGSLSLDGGSPKISRCVISGDLIVSGGSPIISQNKISGFISQSSSGSSVISNNNITGYVVIGGGGAPVISENSIVGLTYYDAVGRSSLPSHGIFIGGDNNAQISGNSISGSFQVGIAIESGTPTIERNLIASGYGGITIDKEASPVIQNNTIITSSRRSTITCASYHPSTIIFNNMQGDRSYGIYLDTGGSGDINATYNWWGITDAQAINQSIHDFKNDLKLGTVTFVPFLTEPNPEAPEMPPTQTPTPTPTQSPTSTPSITPSPTFSPTPTPTQEPQQTESTTIIGAAIVVVTIGAGLGLLIYLIKRK